MMNCNISPDKMYYINLKANYLYIDMVFGKAILLEWQKSIKLSSYLLMLSSTYLIKCTIFGLTRVMAGVREGVL